MFKAIVVAAASALVDRGSDNDDPALAKPTRLLESVRASPASRNGTVRNDNSVALDRLAG